MGSDSSKLDDEEKKDDDIYDPSCIYYDDHGNLRYASGAGTKDRDAELRRIVAVDDNVEEDGKEWWIIDATWVNAWLAYVHYAKNISPAPGPVDNTTLLRLSTEPDGVARKWVPRDGLISAQKSKVGHYRRITKEAWLIYMELYPASGPEIHMTYTSNKDHKDDTSTWIISTSHMPEEKSKRKPKPKNSTIGRIFSSQSLSLMSTSMQFREFEDEGDKDGNRLISGPGGKGAGTELMEDHTITDRQRVDMSSFFGVKPVIVAGTSQQATSTPYSRMLRPGASSAPATSSSKDSKPTPERWLFSDDSKL